MQFSRYVNPLGLVTRLLGLSLIFAAAAAFGEQPLRNYIFIVKPFYHKETKQFLGDLAAILEQKGNKEMAGYLRGYTEGGFGTGFLVKTSKGKYYVITNRHVVDQAEKVTIIKSKSNGEEQTFDDCRILLTSDDADLAVLEIASAGKYFKEGLELDPYDAQSERTKVIAAGYPGIGGVPEWKLSSGEITNESITTPGIVSNPRFPMIQHSATIDPGNSGGPLLVEDPRMKGGYKVVGINTLKALRRENTNYAIPSWVLDGILSKLEGMEAAMKNHSGLVADLEAKCKSMAFEFSSEHPQYESLYRLISYEFVSKWGPQSFLNMSKISGTTDWNKQLLSDPIRTMKLSLFMNIIYELKGARGARLFQYDRLNAQDLMVDYADKGVRTVFLLDGRDRREFVWKMEYGEWKIADFKLTTITADEPGVMPVSMREPGTGGPGLRSDIDTARKFTTVSSPGFRKNVITLQVDGVFSKGYGEAFKHIDESYRTYNASVGLTWGAGLEVDHYFTRAFGIGSGMRYFTRAMSYKADVLTESLEWFNDIDVVERWSGMQIPLVMKIRLWSLGLKLGVAMDLFLTNERKVTAGESSNTAKPENYRASAIPLLLGASWNWRLPAAFNWGIEYTYERPLDKLSKPAYYDASIASYHVGMFLGKGF